MPSVGSIDNSFESWKNTLNSIDESISRPIFRLGLPKWLEFVVSIPANCFGTVACLWIGPLWIALLASSQRQQYTYDDKNEDDNRIILLRIITFSTTILYVVAWGYYQIGGYHKLGMKVFWKSLFYMLAYPWSVGILAYTILGWQADDYSDNDFNDDTTIIMSPKTIFSMAIYPLVMWPPVTIGMTELKNFTRRSRPAKKDLDRGENGENWIRHKKFPATTHFLAKFNGDQSFPSGDVAMATLLAVPLWNITNTKELAVAIVLASGFGRMYVLAHHLSDVVSGCLLTLGVHGAVFTLGGRTMQQTEWWNPFLSLGVFLIIHLTKKDGTNPMDKQGGDGSTKDERESKTD